MSSSTSPTKVPPPTLPSSPGGLSSDAKDATLINKAATILPNAKITNTMTTTNKSTTIATSTNSSSSSSSSTNKNFSGDSSFGYRALRDFRKVLPTVLGRLPKDINSKDFRDALRREVTQHRDNLEKKLRNFNLDNEIILHELEIFRIGGEETFEDELLQRQKYEEEQARLITELANKAKSDIQRIQQEKEEVRTRVEKEQQRLIAEAERIKAEELQAIGNTLLEQMKELQHKESLRQAQIPDPPPERVEPVDSTKNSGSEEEPTTTVTIAENTPITSAPSANMESTVPQDEPSQMVPVPLPTPVAPPAEEKPLSPLQRIKLKTMADIKPLNPPNANLGSVTNTSTANSIPSKPKPVSSTTTNPTNPPPVPVIDPNDPLAEWKMELLAKETPEAIKQILVKEVLVPLDNYLQQVRTKEPLPESLLFIKRSEADTEAKRLLDNCVDKAKRILADIRCPATVADGAISDQRAEMVKTVEKECNGDIANKLANWVTQETVSRIDNLMNERNNARALLARDTFERVLPIAMPKNCRCGIIAAHTELFTGVVKSIATNAPARSGEKIVDQSIKGQNTNESSSRKSFLKFTTSLKTMAKQAKKMVAVALNKDENDTEEIIIEKVEERNQAWADERAVTSMTARAGNVQNTGGFYTALATGKWDCARALLEGTKKDAGAARAAKVVNGSVSSSSGVRLPYISADDVMEAEDTENSLKNSSSEYTEYLLSQHYEDIDVYPDGTLAYAGGRLYRSRVTGTRHGVGAIFEPGVSGVIVDPLRISVGSQSIRLLLSPGHLSSKDVNMMEVNRAVPAVVTEWDSDKLTGVARVFYSGKETIHKGRLLATLYFKNSTGATTTTNEQSNVAEAARGTNPSESVSSNVAMTVVSNVIGVTYVVDPLTIDYA